MYLVNSGQIQLGFSKKSGDQKFSSGFSEEMSFGNPVPAKMTASAVGLSFWLVTLQKQRGQIWIVKTRIRTGGRKIMNPSQIPILIRSLTLNGQKMKFQALQLAIRFASFHRNIMWKKAFVKRWIPSSMVASSSSGSPQSWFFRKLFQNETFRVELSALNIRFVQLWCYTTCFT